MEIVHVVDYATLEVDGQKVMNLNVLNETKEMHVMRKYLRNCNDIEKAFFS